MRLSLICSFCGKGEEDNITIIDGMGAAICNNCSSICNEVFSEATIVSSNPISGIKKPHQIKADLDKYVIGQDDAKKILSVAVYNHYKRIHAKTNVDIQKTNILLIGPTGSGKTYLMQTLANILDVPIVIVDATSLTEAGYVGEDVESILEKLLKKAGGDIQKAQKGIVYIDEIDKLANKVVEGRKNTKDISGEGVQQALLKIIENSDVAITIQNNPYEKVKHMINTKNILFVCGGAFVGIDKITQKRVSPKEIKKVGFCSANNVNKPNPSTFIKEANHDDVIEFGFIPEFIGRIPVIATLNELTKNDLKNILTKPKNAILKQYKALFKIDGISLDFNSEAIDYVVDEAIKKKIGARGLKGVIEKSMYDIMYELPQKENITSFTVTEDILSRKLKKET